MTKNPQTAIQTGDVVGPNDCAWIKAQVVAVEVTPAGSTKVTIEWLQDDRHGNLIARKGARREFFLNRYGVGSFHKIG